MVPATKKPGGKIGSGSSGALLWSGESGSFPDCPGGACTLEPEDGAPGLGVKNEFVNH